jgi:hypothetical protein
MRRRKFRLCSTRTSLFANLNCDLCVTNANIMTRAQVLGGSVIPQTLLFSDGLMAGSSVGGSCEYHQVLETDLLLKCAQELDPSVVADVTTCMLQYQELDPNVVAGL